MAANIVTKIIEMLKMAGIDYSKIAGKIDPNVVKKLTTKTQKTATKPKLIDALNKDKATYGDALKVFEDEAQYISQMNEMELVNFANNLEDYFTVGGKKKHIPSNVVTTEGTPVVGKKLETLAKRKGADVTTDSSLQGGLKGLMSLIDEIKGISPKLRNTMDRNELAKFLKKMRGKKFTNQEIKWVKEYMDDYSIGFAKEKASGFQFGKKLGAKDKDEFEFITEYVDNINTTSPDKFKEMYGTVKNVNMDFSTMIDGKLEKHFKKKFKWDQTKTDGGLDDKTYQLYEDELWDAQKEFSDFHTVYDSGPTNMFGMREGKSWANHPNNWIDEASEKMESITGQGLNVDFFKNYTNDVLSKYPKTEKFQYGGQVIKGPDLGSTAHGSGELASRQRMLQPGGQMTTSTGLNYLLGEDDNNRIPFNEGLKVNSWEEFQYQKKLREWQQYQQFLENYEKEKKQRPYIEQRMGTGPGPILEAKDGGRIPFQGGGADASTESFSKSYDKIHGTNTVATSRPDPVGGPDDRSSPEQTLSHIQQQKKIHKDPHDKMIETIDKGNMGWKAWNMLNAGSIGGAAKAALSFNPYAWAGAGLIGLDKRRKLKKLKEMEDSLTYADGGRIAFGDGGMGRRGFLKLLGGSAAAIAAMKTGLVKLLGGKSASQVKKVIDEVVVNNKTGAPAWFQPLINKILREGKTAENLAYGERQIAKTMDTPSGKVDVIYKLDTGEVELSFVGDKTALGEQVDLVYTPGQVIEEGKYAGKKEGDEFVAAESAPESYVTGTKDDADWSIDLGSNEASNVGDLASDLTELKTFATGEKATIKEIVDGIKKKKARIKMEENPGEWLVDKYGDYPYASGGIARMLGE